VITVYAGMNRDAALSHITNTPPGELGGQFWLQLITFGIGPLVGLLTTLFPSITEFATSWLQPSVQALKRTTHVSQSTNQGTRWSGSTIRAGTGETFDPDSDNTRSDLACTDDILLPDRDSPEPELTLARYRHLR
jgi:hypothetical protein